MGSRKQYHTVTAGSALSVLMACKQWRNSKMHSYVSVLFVTAGLPTTVFVHVPSFRFFAFFGIFFFRRRYFFRNSSGVVFGRPSRQQPSCESSPNRHRLMDEYFSHPIVYKFPWPLHTRTHFPASSAAKCNLAVTSFHTRNVCVFLGSVPVRLPLKSSNIMMHWRQNNSLGCRQQGCPCTGMRLSGQ